MAGHSINLLAGAVLLLVPTSAVADKEHDRALKTIKSADIKPHQAFLAADGLEGRKAGTEGGHKAALYLGGEAAKLGLRPGGNDGSFYQFVGDTAPTGAIEEANFVAWAGKRLKFGLGLKVHRRSGFGAVGGAVRFLGYGIKGAKYSDYGRVRLKGEVVLVLDGGPKKKEVFATVAQKAAWAHEAGASALLVTLGPLDAPQDRDPDPAEWTWPPEPGEKRDAFPIPVAWINRETAAAIAESAREDLSKLEERIGKYGRMRSFTAKGEIRVEVSGTGPPEVGRKNVVAVWPGTDPALREEYILLGAHYDHVGRGGDPGAKGKPGEVHNGADDNASGCAVLLEVAEAVVTCSFKRSVVFVWFDAEEYGLAGARYWVRTPTLPLEKCVAMLNLDMVGRNDVKTIVAGVERTDDGAPKYPAWVEVLQGVEKKFRLKFDWTGGARFIRRGDQWPFMERDIPAGFLHGGMHDDYHKETDDLDKINFAKQALVAKLVFSVAAAVADSGKPLR